MTSLAYILDCSVLHVSLRFIVEYVTVGNSHSLITTLYPTSERSQISVPSNPLQHQYLPTPSQSEAERAPPSHISLCEKLGAATMPMTSIKGSMFWHSIELGLSPLHINATLKQALCQNLLLKIWKVKQNSGCSCADTETKLAISTVACRFLLSCHQKYSLNSS